MTASRDLQINTSSKLSVCEKEGGMPRTIAREEVQELLKEGASLVEVLPSSVYRKGHLPGAINIPLAALDVATTDQLARNKPVVVYCYDFL